MPSYLVSLMVKRNILEAAEFDGILLGSRSIAAWIGSLPYFNRIPILNSMHYLFLPELYGFIAGLSIATVFDERIDSHRSKKNSSKNLENILEKSSKK